MKRKNIVITIACVIFSVFAVIFLLMISNVNINVGGCIVENGVYMIVIDKSPIIMSNKSEEDNFFEGLNTGDKILIINDGIMETYPGKTHVKFLIKIGENYNIPQDVLEGLEESGWIN